ncbi:hypothetical protein GDO81_024588 [Engystomops pustulosus]|uniref:NTR domain-containing protein n=1 Tax=Engystomops pustulosus TaxID=76066 RepID=A0AAV6ZTF1_ENGPU|nr:hypothetical protein GDO81_024588 [Engystomops pustulosus]
MMTGFAPDVDSLNKLQKEVDKYISQFEINNKSIDKGSIIIYLDKMSERENECIKFNVHQIFKVGRIQPASVTLYDYYSPENRCTKFYHVEKNSELLSTICQNSVCRCTEVYKAHLEEIQENNNYDNYVMKIINVTKKGRDEDALNNQRRFLSHIKCRRGLNLIKGRDYLIWGPNSDLWEQPDGFSYVIGRDTWMERWPNDRECQDPENRKQCDDLSELSRNLEFIRCHL